MQEIHREAYFLVGRRNELSNTHPHMDPSPDHNVDARASFRLRHGKISWPHLNFVIGGTGGVGSTSIAQVLLNSFPLQYCNRVCRVYDYDFHSCVFKHSTFAGSSDMSNPSEYMRKI